MNDPHILGTERIGKLLVQYSIPAIIGMTITSLYNIIDSIFIGHGVGAMGIAGLAITFPLMNLVVAFCTVVSAGGSTISSIRLGQKDTDGATEVLNHTLMLCLVNAFLFGGISFIFLDEILRFFGASNETLPYARNFMQIILLGTPVTYTMIGLNNIMRATGYPKKAMLTSMVTVVCNIILAPIFIFHFGWGIRGAATATVISQFIGMIWVVSHFLQKTSIVRLQPGFWKMKKRIISSIFSIGMSPFLMNVTACVTVIIVNNSLQRYGGDMAIGAYGIMNRLLVLYVMIVLGLTMGMQPIVGYNFGAQKYDRVKATLRLSILTGVCITSTGFIICELFPHAVSAVFTSDGQLIDMASRGVRIGIAMFPLVGAQIVIGNFFQSIGKAKISIFLSLTRQLLYLLPGLIILPRYMGLDGIWTCMPVSDFFAFVTAVIALWIYVKKLNRMSPLNTKSFKIVRGYARHHAAVEQVYRAVCKRGIVPGVRHHDNGSAFPVQFRQQVHHFRTVLGVQVTGRLIGKNQFRVRHHGAGNGYTLLLTAGKLLRKVLGTVADVHPFQDIIYHALAFTRFHAQIGKRQFYIFVNVQLIYQVEALEHESQLAFAHAGTFFLFQVRHFLPKQLITAFRRIVQQTEYIQ